MRGKKVKRLRKQARAEFGATIDPLTVRRRFNQLKKAGRKGPK